MIEPFIHNNKQYHVLVVPQNEKTICALYDIEEDKVVGEEVVDLTRGTEINYLVEIKNKLLANIN